MSVNFSEIKKWAIETENIEYQTPIFSLKRRKSNSRIQDKSGQFYVIEAPDWVNVLALTKEMDVVLVKQYRHGIDEITLEIPGGVVDSEDDNSQLAAERELLEETGYKSVRWEYLGTVSSNPAIFTNYCHFYLATECEKVSGQNLDHLEEIGISTLPLKEFLGQVRDGSIHHSLIVAAVAQFLLKKPALIPREFLL